MPIAYDLIVFRRRCYLVIRGTFVAKVNLTQLDAERLRLDGWFVSQEIA